MGRAARARQQLEKASDLDGPAETDADKAAAAPGADVNGNGDEPWWKYWGMNSNSGRMPGSMPDTSAGSTSEATGKSDEGLSPGRPIPAWGAWGERPVEGLSPGGSKPIQMHVNDFFKSAGDGLNAAGKSTGDFFKDLGENTVKIGENTVKTIAESGEAIGKVALAPVKLFDSKVLGRRSPKRARSFRKAAVEQAALEKATREAFSTREAERLQPRDLVATARARRTGAMLMAWQAQAGFGARSTAARGFAALLLGLIVLLAIGIVEFDGITLPVVAFDLFATLRWPRMLAIYRL